MKPPNQGGYFRPTSTRCFKYANALKCAALWPQFQARAFRASVRASKCRPRNRLIGSSGPAPLLSEVTTLMGAFLMGALPKETMKCLRQPRQMTFLTAYLAQIPSMSSAFRTAQHYWRGSDDFIRASGTAASQCNPVISDSAPRILRSLTGILAARRLTGSSWTT